MIPNDYHCTQDALYEGGDLIITSLEEEFSLFAAFKAKYDLTFVSNARAILKAAVELPDVTQRIAEAEIKRIELTEDTKEVYRKQANALRLYMRDAYTNADIYKVRLSEAGFDDYEAAFNYNWEKLRGFMQAGLQFISAHLTELTAAGMPGTFSGEWSNSAGKVNTRITEMLNLRENNLQATEAKIIANNTLYKLLISICEDGQFVFEGNEAKRVQFVWQHVQDMITPPGEAGLRFDVKEQGTNVPLAGVTAKLQKEGDVEITTTTDAEGKGMFENMSAGFYEGKLVLNGFVSLEIEVEISKGVTSFKHWLLVRV